MGKFLRVPILFVIAVVTALVPSGIPSGGAAVPASFPKQLILANWFANNSPSPTPIYIRDHKTFLESQPFNGMVVYLRDDVTLANATRGITTTTSWPTASIASILAPMQGLGLTTMANNFALVQVAGTPDFFDDWTVPIQNFSHLAQAVKDAGLKGIFFDNEQYIPPSPNWANYPDGVAHPQFTLAQYQAQARLRGNQVMAAIIAIYPTIAVFTAHGPYISEPSAPASMFFPQVQSYNELLGPFFVGMRETIGDVSENVDGGELYGLRSATEFLNSYNWRKYTIADASTNCAFIPASNPDDRTAWSWHTSISFGVYDSFDSASGRSMDPPTVTTTLRNALAQSDHYVWFYPEAYSYLIPSNDPSGRGAPQTWVSAVRASLSPPPVPKGLIYNGWKYGPTPTPSYLQTNFSWIDTHLPFDGQVVYARNPAQTINLTGGIMSSSSYDVPTITSVLSPMQGLNWTRVKNNFVFVITANAPLPWDGTGWNTVKLNFGNLAQVCQTVGLKGIFFDNENYGGWWGHLPSSPGPDWIGPPAQPSTAQYQAQLRLRGNQIMTEMVSKFPAIQIFSTHGPYISEPAAGATNAFAGHPDIGVVNANPLTGAFFVGFREALGSSAVNLDGGELYTLRSTADFSSAYTWRKTTFASSTVNCRFLPPTTAYPTPDDRTGWSTATSISFGIYDLPWQGVAMDSTIAGTTVHNALQAADRYVWFYTEARSFYVAPGQPQGATQDWVDVFNAGRAP